MRIIGEVCDFIRDELSGVEKYANVATHYKAEYKDLADLLFAMANTEATHLKNLHAWLTKSVEKIKRESMKDVPQGMLDVWEWEHRSLIKRFNEVEIALQNYQKL